MGLHEDASFMHLIHLLVCHLLMHVVGHQVPFLDPAFLRRASS
jgi:hypothetical protein